MNGVALPALTNVRIGKTFEHLLALVVGETKLRMRQLTRLGAPQTDLRISQTNSPMLNVFSVLSSFALTRNGCSRSSLYLGRLRKFFVKLQAQR